MDEISQLCREAATGDRQALEELVRAIQQDVWQLCAVLGRRGEADDLAQESLMRVVRALPSYRGEGSGRAWVLSIARRTCMDDLRRGYRLRALTERIVGESRSTATSSADVTGYAGLAALVRSLDPDQRSAFVLTQVIGLSYEEAAEACACPVGTIRSRVSRARIELAEQLRRSEAV